MYLKLGLTKLVCDQFLQALLPPFQYYFQTHIVLVSQTYFSRQFPTHDIITISATFSFNIPPRTNIEVVGFSVVDCSNVLTNSEYTAALSSSSAFSLAIRSLFSCQLHIGHIITFPTLET